MDKSTMPDFLMQGRAVGQLDASELFLSWTGRLESTVLDWAPGKLLSIKIQHASYTYT